MPLMTRKYTAVDGINYAVCGLCESLNQMGRVYDPVFWVWPDGYDKEDRQNNSHKLQLCYGCYFNQWMEVQSDHPFPDHLIDGRVQLALANAPPPEVLATLQKLEALAASTGAEAAVAKNKVKELALKYNMQTEDYAEMVPGKGLTVVTNDEYVKWEHALKVARGSNGAESVDSAYNRLYRSKADSVEVTAGAVF